MSNTQFYEEELWPLISSECLSCHQSGGPAEQSAFLITSDQQASEEMIWSMGIQTIGSTDQSWVLSKARGLSNHGGGMRVLQNSVEERLVKEWTARAQEEICQECTRTLLVAIQHLEKCLLLHSLKKIKML